MPPAPCSIDTHLDDAVCIRPAVDASSRFARPIRSFPDACAGSPAAPRLSRPLYMKHVPLLQGCNVARTKNRPHGSSIAHKNPTPTLLLTLPEFSVRMLLIRTENVVGARNRKS